MLVDGKKSTAERIVYGALEGAAPSPAATPWRPSKKAMDNVQPPSRSAHAASAAPPTRFRLRSSRAAPPHLPCGGWWLLQGPPRKDDDRASPNEILDASNGLGAAVKRREDTHKMAESNKAFAHYRW